MCVLGGRRGYVLLELGHGFCGCCFDAVAVLLRTGDFCAGAVVVALAVGCGRVLGEVLEVLEDFFGDGWMVG